MATISNQLNPNVSVPSGLVAKPWATTTSSTKSASAGQLLKLLVAAPALFAQRVNGDLASNDALRAPGSIDAFGPSATEAIAPVPAEALGRGRLDCPCIPLTQTSLTASPLYNADSDCLLVRQPNGDFCYPLDYGTQGCKAYDEMQAPYCNQDEGFPGNPDWCTKTFCYVDPNNCNDTEFYPSSYFANEDLHYSYSTCGDSNTFLGMINDNLDHSFMELVTAVEKGLVATKREIESQYDEISAFSRDPKKGASECTYADGCGPILEGQQNECWKTKVDFNNVNVVLHPSQRQRALPQDLNALACLHGVVRPAFLGIADAEHDDKNRIAYQYYGDQKTGGLIEYPQLKFCSETFDARFRPWYASAASGPKDVVVVIDTSGSMKGERIKLATQAAQAVAHTLTWADRISLITFNGGVAEVYNDTLVQGNENNVRDIASWVESKFVAYGDTDFSAPLNKAYEILKNNKDANDQKTCSQAILFLTDGEDPTFDISNVEPAIKDNPDAVVFTYGLSTSADKTKLQEIACRTNGIFHPVQNAVTLPNVMAAYYEYYTSLQDSGKISWINYKDVTTSVELLTACAPVLDFDIKGMQQPNLLGVNCMDLNIIVDLATLKTCEGNSYDQFIESVFREATQCSSKGSRITDECTLQNMRAKISPDSVCASQIKPLECEIGPQPTASDFSGLSPRRFQKIPLDNCSVDNVCAADAKESKSTVGKTKSGLGAGALTGIALGSIAGVGAALYLAIKCCKRSDTMRDNRQVPASNANRPEDTYPAARGSGAYSLALGGYPAAAPPSATTLV